MSLDCFLFLGNHFAKQKNSNIETITATMLASIKKASATKIKMSVLALLVKAVCVLTLGALAELTCIALGIVPFQIAEFVEANLLPQCQQQPVASGEDVGHCVGCSTATLWWAVQLLDMTVGEIQARSL